MSKDWSQALYTFFQCSDSYAEKTKDVIVCMLDPIRRLIAQHFRTTKLHINTPATTHGPVSCLSAELWDLNRTWVFQTGEGHLQHYSMLLDETRERLIIGGRGVLYSLNLERIAAPHKEVRPTVWGIRFVQLGLWMWYDWFHNRILAQKTSCFAPWNLE